MSKVLVTGYRGYIGAVLVPKLLDAGHDVVGVDIGWYDDGLTQVNAPTRALAMDVRDITVDVLKGCDSVIHLAALSNDPLGDLDPALTKAINLDASLDLAQKAKAAGVRRFLFASSCSIYGAVGEELLDENAAVAPLTPYAEAKAKAELGLRELADRKFCPAFVRASTAYGVSPSMRYDLVVNNLTAWAAATGRINIKSDGLSWRPLVHVEDLADAYLALLRAPTGVIYTQAFNVGASEENYRVNELAEIVRQTMVNTTIRYADAPIPDKRSYRVSCERISQALPDYKVRWTVTRGVQQLVAALSDQPLQVEDFEGPPYTRLAALRRLQDSKQVDTDLVWTAGKRPAPRW